VDEEMLIPDYFAAFLRTSEAKAYFLRCAKKTTNLASINMTQLKGLPVPTPPLSEQLRFQKAKNMISRSREARKHAVSYAASLFHALVQSAFRGEL
jgi:type I restriction enzyme S subunit